MKPRNTSYDATVAVARGVGIIAVVLGHGGVGEIARIVIFAWHMPLFFMFSGFFFREDKYSVRRFLGRKIRSLYVPYLVWSLIFLALHNVLVDIGISPPPLIGIFDYVRWVISILLLHGRGEIFLLTFWFLKELLIVNVMALFIAKGLSRCVKGKISRRMWLALTVAALTVAVVLSAAEISVFSVGWRTFLALAFFFAGRLMAEFDVRRVAVVAVAVVLILCLHDGSFHEMRVDLAWAQIPFFCVIAVCSVVIIYNLSALIATRGGVLSAILEYVGNNSLPIMILHMVAFRIINLLIIAIWQLPYAQYAITHVPIFPTSDRLLWIIVFAIGGTALPLLLHRLYLLALAGLGRDRQD